ncbi:glycosyltransferase [Candidatus Magnetoovum chiemensis]|nr:glycosyltransferase [Candidatus Magnetoovum chiemensis]
MANFYDYIIEKLLKPLKRILTAKHSLYIKNSDYYKWIKTNEPSNYELKEQIGASRNFTFKPIFSVFIIPGYVVNEKMINATIESLNSQSYSNWEVFVFSANVNKRTAKMQERKLKNKCTVSFFNNLFNWNYLNDAFYKSKGEYLAFIVGGDKFSPFSFYETVKALNDQQNTEFLYGDEDRYTHNVNKRSSPFFKPDWSPDTLKGFNYIGNTIFIRRDLFKQCILSNTEFNSYSLVLRATRRANKIIHIPKILYHAMEKDSDNYKTNTFLLTHSNVYTSIYNLKALKEYLTDTKTLGDVKEVSPGLFDIRYNLSSNPKVSIIIPNKDHADDLKKCIESLQRSIYRNFEIIIVENKSAETETFRYYCNIRKRSNIRIITWQDEFNFSKINNHAARYAQGDVLFFLNNDTEAINADFMERMLQHCVRPDVGAVGAKLYYPDGTIQHAGIILGICGLAGHSHKGIKGDLPGYFHRLEVVQNLSAVTAACIMVRTDVFNKVGGFDECFPIAYNDIDFCLKIRRAGYSIIWTPFAKFYHYESRTRGYDITFKKKKRLKCESNRLKLKWNGVFEDHDPFYNPNLTVKKEDFSINI